MRLSQPVGPKDYVHGFEDAPVTLVAYMDYECPQCAQAHRIVSAVLDLVGPLARFVPRHFPISQRHPNAVHAAQAVEAAGAQGHFWAMHATLLEDQDALDPEALIRHASALGLDVQRFSAELRSGQYLHKVLEDFRSAMRGGVNGTPTLYLNGFRHDGGWSAPTLMAAIRRAAAGGGHVARL